MPQTYELNLRDYWNIFRKRRWIIMMIFFTVFGFTIIYTSFQPLLYKAVAVVKIEPERGVVDEVFFRQYYLRQPELADYEELIRSRPIIERAIKESGLIDRDATPQELGRWIRIIYSGLSTRAIEKTHMIRIGMTSEDPEEAAIILNKIVEAVKLENIKQKNQQAINVRKFIEEQLQKISVQLRESEGKLKALTLKGVGALATSLTNKIVGLESRRSDLLADFTRLHPDVIRIDEQITSLEAQLKNLPEEEFEFGILKREAVINERLYNLLREKMQEAQIKEAERIDNIILISPAVPPRYPFHPNKPANYSMGIILGIVLGLVFGLVNEQLDTSIGKIEDLESVTKVNVIGVIPYFIEKGKDIKEGFKRRKGAFSARRVKREEKIARLHTQLIITHKKSSVFLEASRILGANVQVIFGEGGRIKQKCLLITSSNPQEGKSIIAANLSIIMAQMGYRTVLIDLDLRRSIIHDIFHLESKNRGVTDVLTGALSLEQVLRTITDLLLGEMNQEDLLKNPWMDNFHLITAGTTFPNAPYLLNTENMNTFLKDLRERFDVIIMDSSPVLAVSDTSIIVPKIDGVLLVYRAGATSRIALRRAKTQIESVKGSLKGIVLNNITPEVSADAYYYYYPGKYGKYYQEEEEEGKKT